MTKEQLMKELERRQERSITRYHLTEIDFIESYHKGRAEAFEEAMELIKQVER